MTLLRHIAFLLCFSVAAQTWALPALDTCACCTEHGPETERSVEAPSSDQQDGCCAVTDPDGQEQQNAGSDDAPTEPTGQCDCPKACCIGGKIFPAGIMTVTRGVALDHDAQRRLSPGAVADLPAHVSRLKRPPRAISFV